MFSVTFFTVMIQIISRFIPSLIVPWTEEITRMSFIFTICFGAPLAIKYGEYARVDLIFNFVPLRVRLLLECISIILIAAMCLIVGYSSIPMIELGGRQLSIYLRIPMYFTFAAIPLSFIMSFISSVFKTAEAFKDFFNPQEVERREREEAEKLLLVNEDELQVIREAAAGEDGGESK
jgi:TRAP-type C4-dicarboxylate transport system permease small subunit